MQIGSDHHVRSEIRHMLNVLQLSARLRRHMSDIPDHPHDPIPFLLIRAEVEQSP